MNVKIQCSCGTKFSFDVEPVDGKMPVEIFCPKCGADATENANQTIQQSLSGENAVAATSSAQKPRIRLQVAHAAPVVSSGGSGGDSAESPRMEMCHRHSKNLAVEHCVVCGKPICPECMQTFGYLCSIGCRYRAEQEKIRVPVYKLQKGAVEKAALRKHIAITVSVIAILLALVGAWFWYIIVGDKPRPFYSLKVSDEAATYAKFLNPNQILLLSRKHASLHDIKSKKDVWSTAIDDPKPDSGAKPSAGVAKRPGQIDLDEMDESFGGFLRPEPFFHGDDVWLCLSHNVVAINLKSGEIKQTTPFQGRVSSFTPSESTLLVVSEKVPTKKIVTQISLNSSEIKTQEVESSLREKVSGPKDLPSNVLPTAALLLKRELDAGERHEPSIYKFSSEFFPDGENLVEMQVKLEELKTTSVQTIKPAGPSNLNQDTRASTSVRSVQEEIFNDMKRSRTGGYKQIDESRYAVLLRRATSNEAKDWSGDVNGLPMFFPQKTVDVLVAGKSLFFFDKQNKKIAEAQLTYPIDESFSSGFNRGRAPCVEREGTLYFFDQGVLTAFSLPDCAVRWRLPSVGISEIQFDEKGMLYVSTTTGAPEDIQYSEQIKMNDAPQAIILKVNPAGKTLWKCDQSGGGLFLTGKYLYITDASHGGFSLINATKEAFETGSTGPGTFRVVRIDPSNGKKMWSFIKKGAPENVDFCENRILLHYGKEIQILKFLSF